jgi:hypothetical protein
MAATACDDTEDTTFYWLVIYEHEDCKKSFRRFDDKDEALKAMWKEAEGPLIDELRTSDEERAKWQKRVEDEECFFAWTWHRKGYFVCGYLIEGEADEFVDNVDVHNQFNRFSEWRRDTSDL